jgi:NADPH:quinone reductase-like Zn-dependent oxidoreductase
MRAVHLTAVNQLNVTEVPEPPPAPGEVVVALRAAALNHRDVWIKSGLYAGLKWPCLPGSDGAGEVVALGAEVDAAWLGREVIINPCFGWGDREDAQAPDFSILGLPRPGTLAEKIAVPAAQVEWRPAHLNWMEAAALPLGGLTAYRAVFTRGKVRSGERVLVSGIGGGVATLALQFAVAAGARVWVTSSSLEKIARAVALGAEGGFDYRDEQWAAKAVKAGGPFDVVIDSAGGDGFSRLIDAAAPGGRIVIYGATRGDGILPMRKVFWRHLSVLGTTMGSPSDWSAMVAFVAEKRIRPVVGDVFPLEQAGAAFARMERGEQFGKIVVMLRT